MKTYGYTRLHRSVPIRLLSTDSKTIKFLEEEVKKVIPSIKTEYEFRDLSGELVEIRFEPLSSQKLFALDGHKDRELGVLIMQLLCQNGWEPFAIEQGNYGDSSGIHFRRETDS